MNPIPRLLALLGVVLTLCAMPASARTAPAAISVTDDHGTTITLAAPPQRLISLAPNVTEMLFALGLGPKVVGVSSYSNYPKQAASLPVVINYTSLNQEKLLSLKPDLIVAAAIVPPTIVAKLRALHLTVLMTDPHDVAGILADLRLVATAAGVPVKGRQLAARLQVRVDTVRATVRRAATHPRIFYELDKTLYTAGHGSFVDALITMAGGTNIAGTVMNPYPQLSTEKVIAANPELIILGDATYGGVTAAAVAARPGWAAINAVQHHRIYAFNDDLVSRPGPRIVDGLEALARLIHPNLFR
jgi:iron complex transport system substrate-binding protein